MARHDFSLAAAKDKFHLKFNGLSGQEFKDLYAVGRQVNIINSALKEGYSGKAYKGMDVPHLTPTYDLENFAITISKDGSAEDEYMTVGFSSDECSGSMQVCHPGRETLCQCVPYDDENVLETRVGPHIISLLSPSERVKAQIGLRDAPDFCKRNRGQSLRERDLE